MKIKCIYIGWLLLFVVTGCSDWLDVRPRKEMKEEDMFAHEDGFKNALTGAYIQLASEGLYGKNTSMLVPDMLAQLWSRSTNKTSSDYNLMSFDYTHSAVEPTIDAIWSSYYKCIVHLNNVLANLETTEAVFSNGNDKLVKGEALGLRAFLHLELLRLFGPVPNVQGVENKPAIPYQETMTKKTGDLKTLLYKDVCQKIIRDLNAAEELLNEDPILFSSNRDLNSPSWDWDEKPRDEWQFYRQVRFNYYAVKAAKARYYHWIGDKDNAVKCAKEVVDAKNDDGLSKFELATESSYSGGSDLVMQSEHIFGVHNPDHQNIVESLFKNETARLKQTATSVNNAYEKGINPDDIRNKGTRYWEEKVYQNASKVNHFKKYVEDDSRASINTIPLLRLAEMYFILIEDLSQTDAQTYFKTFRIARNLNITLDNSLTSEQAVLDRLEKEYLKDFYGEGQMWFFYKRHNYARLSWPKALVLPVDAYLLPIPKSQNEFED
ncbi:RagB/SusD family nutrient uptake outer membrane protein [Butyricimonas sp.]|uniref:RagB/SusD family nutrient uptake outer membrane protein n=1 Tax=Butyricimonas sp. TaxID=1969738 RepID=UPI0025BBF6E6|nr:RagB/SusD family nutrient uptake outer membrane protein [Butyricimonas sp.]